MSRLWVASALCISLGAPGMALAQASIPGTPGVPGVGGPPSTGAGAAGSGIGNTSSTISPGAGASDNGMVAAPNSGVDAGIKLLRVPGPAQLAAAVDRCRFITGKTYSSPPQSDLQPP